MFGKKKTFFLKLKSRLCSLKFVKLEGLPPRIVMRFSIVVTPQWR